MNGDPPGAAAPVAIGSFRQLDPRHVLDALDTVGLRGDGRVLQLNSYENRVFQVFLEDGSAVVAKFYRPGRWRDAQIVEEHAFALELAAAEVPVVPPLLLRPDDDAAARGLLRVDGDPPTLAHWRAPGADAARGDSLRVDGIGPDAVRGDSVRDEAVRPAAARGDDARALDTPADGAASATAGDTAATDAPWRFMVARRCAGREPDLDDDETLRRIGRFIGRLHAAGRARPFVHRLHLRPAVDGAAACAILLDGGFVADTERAAWRQAADAALAAAVDAFDNVAADGPVATLRLHGDCHVGNVLWRDGLPHVVDLDDALQGPAVQDLWMLVSGDHRTMARQLDRLLAGYEEFSDFDDRERRLIEPLRTLRMLRHSAWLAARWGDPTFPLNFPYFGSAAYWRQQTAQLREQLELMTG